MKRYYIGSRTPPDDISNILIANYKTFARHYRGKYVYLSDCCEVCGSYEKLRIHHIAPIYEFGKHNERNLMVLCKKHHREAHNGKTELPRGGEAYRKLVKKRDKLNRKTMIASDDPVEVIFRHITNYHKIQREGIKIYAK